MRWLKPLRFITHNIGLKMIVTALFDSFGPIANVLMVLILVWLIFAILAVNFWKGKLFYCDRDPYVYSTQETCERFGGAWIQATQHFDDVPSAMLTLFAVSTLENWQDIMYQTRDTT